MRMSYFWLYQPQPSPKRSQLWLDPRLIDRTMRMITKGTKGTTTWKQTHFRPVMSESLQLPHTGSSRTGVEKEVVHSSPRVDTLEVKELCLDDVWGFICTAWKVTIPPFGTVGVHDNTSVRGHCMQFHVFAEPMPDPSCLTQWC